MLDISSLITEQVNEATLHIDAMSTEQRMRVINAEDRQVAASVEQAIPQIADAADRIVHGFRRGGRLFYFGAGTSGRLGILDASECPPTYGTDPQLVRGIIAGGPQAIQESVEGAEDSLILGQTDVIMHGVRADDVVVGIAASGRTPYVLGAMQRARELGATVIGVCNNEHTPMRTHAHVMIEVVVGPEVVMGSTRMKAGTAQKLVLNMLTTASMIRMGKVYGNLMVDVQPSNEKLIARAKRIIKLATNASDEQAEAAFAAAEGHVKTAIIMIAAKVDADEARARLKEADGFVSRAISGGMRME
ncbi:N-acetylmuramic acid 6-phosphate etherase [Paenibacillus apiarius]|uniref:N-acetylmuramic acid 6-phosphate etherase n=1 Tax=Paenibacillus apiarius TaxID=46240 RepID=UPI003B3B37EF